MPWNVWTAATPVQRAARRPWSPAPLPWVWTTSIPSFRIRRTVASSAAGPGPPVGTSPAARPVGRRLPEVAGLHGVLDAVLDPDPFALEAHAPLLVRMRVHRRHRVRFERHDRQHRVDTREDPRRDAGSELPDDAALAEVVEHTISFRVRLQPRPEPL